MKHPASMQQMLVSSNNYYPLLYIPYFTCGRRKFHLYMSISVEFLPLTYAFLEKYKISKLPSVLSSSLSSQTSLSRERFLSSELNVLVWSSLLCHSVRSTFYLQQFCAYGYCFSCQTLRSCFFCQVVSLSAQPAAWPREWFSKCLLI